MATVNPYCEANDVINTLPRILRAARTSQSIIGTDIIDNEILKISAEMDSRFFAVGIDVPVVTDSDERVKENLKRISINGVCAGILKSLYQPGDDNFALSELYETQYYRDISFIERNGLGLDEEKGRHKTAPSIGPNFTSASDPLVEGSRDPNDWVRW